MTENLEIKNNEISQDERIMAALAHGGIFLPMTGVIVPIVIWVTQKDKSRYVAFQAFQALLFHIALVVFWFISMGCYMASFFAIFAGTGISSSLDLGLDFYIFPLFPMVTMGGALCGGFLFVIYGLTGAVMTLMGKDFRYLLIGALAERIRNRKNSV